MAAQGSISLNDSSAVAHVFAPAGKLQDGKGTLRWINRLAANPAASEYMTLQTVLSKADSTEVAVNGTKVPMNNFSLRLGTFVTYTDADTGLVMPAYPLWAACTFGVPVRASSTASNDLASMLSGMINAALFKAHLDGSALIY